MRRRINSAIAIAAMAMIVAAMTVVVAALLLSLEAINASSPVHAQPGSTTSMTASSSATTTAYMTYGTLNATEQRQNAQGNGLNLSGSAFSCTASQDCTLVRIARCENGLPSQSACISSAYYPEYSGAYNSSIGRSAGPCPMYIMATKIYCSCDPQAGTCNEVYGQP